MRVAERATWTRIATIALLVAGAARDDAEETAAPKTSDAAIKCLQTDRIGKVEPLDAKLVLLHGIVGKTFWVNRLPNTCAGLRPTSKVLFSSGYFNNLICSGDAFTYTNSMTAYGSPSPEGYSYNRCIFGAFEKVTPEQVEMLRKAESPQ